MSVELREISSSSSLSATRVLCCAHLEQLDFSLRKCDCAKFYACQISSSTSCVEGKDDELDAAATAWTAGLVLCLHHLRLAALLALQAMASVSHAEPKDDVSQVVVLLDVNPYFWGRKLHAAAGSSGSAGLTFNQFLQHALMFMNSVLLLNHLNQLVVIATGARSCGFIYNSRSGAGEALGSKHNNQYVSPSAKITQQVEKFLLKEEVASNEVEKEPLSSFSSLLSGSLSLALCYIQRSLKAGPPQPQPRILCLQGSSDAPQQYVAVMNAIFSAQRSMVPIDTCMVGTEHSAFLQQAAHITGGIYMKPPQPEGLFQYLAVVFATDLHSRRFLQLPRPTGVDFRASCFCHKKTIDMGFVCSVCLSIFCKHHKTCATCGANFNQSKSVNNLAGQKRKQVSS